MEHVVIDLKVSLPVQRVWINKEVYSFKESEFLVKPLAYIRTPVSYANKHLNRYYYDVVFDIPEGVLVELGAVYSDSFGRSVRYINRKSNSKWKPPVKNWVEDFYRIF